ncbi:peptidase M20, partial [Salmonella enterica subsp. enterica serovar Virchow]|nr:peptidase M20 [Salmonella enterica subsp. enterica serovar Virchow]
MTEPLLEGVDAYIASHRDRILAELFSLIRQPSVSARGEGMQPCADLLASLMQASGVESVEQIATAGYPVVYGAVEGLRKDKTLLVYGHYDVQAPEPLDAWVSPPFEPEIRDGKIYGRGSSDNKAQLFIFLKAVEILRALTGEAPLNMRFLFEGEEEIGSPNLAGFARANRARLQADATVFSDGHRHQSGRPTATLGVKGMLYVELSVDAAGRDHHSMHATSIPNPVWRLVWALNALRSASDAINIPGFHASVRAPTALEAAAIEGIPEAESLAAEFGVDALLPGRVRDGYHW